MHTLGVWASDGFVRINGHSVEFVDCRTGESYRWTRKARSQSVASTPYIYLVVLGLIYKMHACLAIALNSDCCFGSIK